MRLSPSRPSARSAPAELLRIISALAVVCIHASSGAGLIPYAFFNAVTRFSVPVFIMISGRFMLAGEHSLRDILKKCLRLLAMIILWGCVYALFDHFGRDVDFSSPWDFISYVLTNPVHFWYFYTAAALYLFTPFLAVLCRNASEKVLFLLCCLLFFFGCIVTPALNSGLFPTFSALMERAHFSPELGMLFFYVFGYYAVKFPPGKNLRRTLYILGALGCCLTFASVILAEKFLPGCASVPVSFYFPGNALGAMAVYLLIPEICRSGRPARFAEKLAPAARLTTGVYIIHILILEYVSRPLLDGIIPAGFLSVIANTAVTFLLSLGITFCLRLIPGLKKLL